VPLRRLAFAAAVALHLAVIYAPQAPGVPAGLPVDKVVHAVVFGMVLWCGHRAGVPLLPLSAVLVVHAPVSELLQAAVLPDRSGDPWDAVADVMGVGLAFVALHRPLGGKPLR
jgi:hypothetical protein